MLNNLTRLVYLTFVGAHLVSFLNANVLNSFDDSILFKINWPGKGGYDLLDPENPGESMVVTTQNKEKYKCILPKLKEKEKDADEEYVGPNALELMSSFFQLASCHSRIESYWTYEICHGKYVKQYHEDREGKKVTLQEYFLGRWDKFMSTALSEELDKQRQDGKSFPPIKKLDGMSLPYLQLNFTDGTVCDLNGKPRQTHVLYVCYLHGKNEIYSIKEISTCVYEVIVLTALLCQHPQYRPQETGENDINCLPINDSPKKPLSLLQLEAESLKQRHFKSFGDGRNEKLFSVYSIQEYKDKHGRKQVRVELLPLDEDDIEYETVDSPASQTAESRLGDIVTAPSNLHPHENTVSPLPPTSIPISVQEFISGKDCPRGSSGWWKFKFCFGISVEQYHTEKGPDGNVHKTKISLGVFNRKAHIDWITKNPHKKPKPLESRTYLSHYYGDGSFCEKTGKPRETVVKLKCERKGSVSLYLLEPNVCQYELGVESSLVCDLLDKVDEYGLLNDVELTQPNKP